MELKSIFVTAVIAIAAVTAWGYVQGMLTKPKTA